MSGHHPSPHVNHLGQPVGEELPHWHPPAPPASHPLAGRYCVVERLDASRHANALYEANALDTEGRNWTYLPYGPFATLGEYRQWIERECAGTDPMFFAIVDADPRADARVRGTAVGVAAYLRIVPASGAIEVGHINYSPRLQRSRAATEAMYLMMSRAFELGYRRYEWKCNTLNLPSRAAALRLGFSFEGIWRQATVVKGRNRDTAWYAIIDKDWPALRSAFKTWLSPDNFDESGQQRTSLSALTAPIVGVRG